MIILGRPRLPLDLDRAREPATFRIDLRRVRDQRLVPDREVVHLRKLAGTAPFPYTQGNTFVEELKRLWPHGLIAKKSEHGTYVVISCSGLAGSS